MTTAACGHRKHTPIVSGAQRRLFGAATHGNARNASGLTEAKAKEHLKEARGKDLPEFSKPKRRAK